jgi:pimeloyl-ACP methyl ester carboxylesterase
VGDAGLHVEWLGAGAPVLLVHGSFVHPDEIWRKQRGLAQEFRLGIVHRRGYGLSPDPDGRVDFERDGYDLAELPTEPAHLVGHSYGGIGCLYAAALRPAAVLSLTVIEPPAFALAPGDPAAVELRSRLARVFARDTDPCTLYGDFLAAWGFNRPTPEWLERQDGRALASSAGERPPWEAAPPLAELAAGGFPTLVVRGDWSRAPAAARELAAPAFAAVADALERELGADRLVVPGANHTPQLLGRAFNDPLRTWLRAATGDGRLATAAAE